MYLPFLILIVAMMAVGAHILGHKRSAAVAGGNTRVLHSRPSYYGAYAALWVAIPAFVLMVLWLAIEPFVLGGMLRSELPDSVLALPPAQLQLITSTIKSLATGGVQSTSVESYMEGAAASFKASSAVSRDLMSILVVLMGAVGGTIGWRRIHPEMRARNIVELVVKIMLIACSLIAILTTVGIVLSMLFETIHFFSMISPIDFFFGTVWDPRFTSAGREGGGQGQFGMLPLMWGTIFVALTAMLVAVPIGLMSAMYLAEYAPSKVRATAKPMLEILAGIPTVVYGFFALITVGPFLRDLGGTIGLDVDARSTLTAGFVMGIMIIPFISSLSDDVITAVPRAMREGSLGLGATKSETIRKVIFPAALPGIVGSILLAVSRAIGETMIVVMAAGVAANLTANPFAPITTVTVKIVNQLTGDQEFTSPQTLVAFALGMTLFVMTLGLNIFALHIVRKYREQYE